MKLTQLTLVVVVALHLVVPPACQTLESARPIPQLTGDGIVSVSLKGVDPARGPGPIQVALWGSRETFMKDGQWVRSATVPIASAEAGVNFTGIPFGRYSVSAFHDATDCGKFRRDGLGLPRDPWAISNGGPHWLPPSWRQSSFEVGAAEVEITLDFGQPARKSAVGVQSP